MERRIIKREEPDPQEYDVVTDNDEELKELSRQVAADEQRLVSKKRKPSGDDDDDPKPEKEPKYKTELEKTKAEIAKVYGDEAVMPARFLPLYNCTSTGSFIMDLATLGGSPDGLANVRYGRESSGKTTLAIRAIAASQRKFPDKHQLWIDREGTFDKGWAEKHGIDLDRLEISRPETGEEAVNIMDSMMSTWEISDVVLDSIPACVPKVMTDNAAEDKTWSELAKLMGIMCSKVLTSWLTERKRGHWVTVHLINQYRDSMAFKGSPNKLPGGRQLNYLVTTKYKHTNVEVMGKDSFGMDVVNVNKFGFKLEKAKIGMSIRSGEFDMVVNPDHTSGLDVGTMLEAETVATFAKRMDYIVKGKGGWQVKPLGEAFRKGELIFKYLYKNPDAFLLLKQIVLARQRVEKGLPALPPDGYLLGWDAAKRLPKSLLEA